MRKYLLNYAYSFLVISVVFAIFINFIALLIGLGNAFVDWEIAEIYKIFNNMYATPKDIRSAILMVFGISSLTSILVAAIRTQNE